MPEVKETHLELDFNALRHNYTYLRSLLKPSTRFLSVVKAFAYGHDAEAVALELQELGTDYFAVAYTAEGVALRDAGVSKPILVLHPQPANFKTIIDRCLEPNLYNARTLRLFLEAAKANGQQHYPVHLKIQYRFK